MNSSSADSLADRLGVIQERIDSRARGVGRSPDDITLIVVTKFHPASFIRDLYGLGVRDCGENRHQEATVKSHELSDLDLTWHFIGQLQSNKAKAVLEYADVIHSVDRSSVVDALDAAWHGRREVEPATSPIEIFLQLNLTPDPHRGGVQPHELVPFAETVMQSPAFNIRGVMAVAPLDEDPAQAFARVARASNQLQAVIPTATAISAGMSHDFETAIDFGATHLRIGSAITGNRPHPG